MLHSIQTKKLFGIIKTTLLPHYLSNFNTHSMLIYLIFFQGSRAPDLSALAVQ